MVCVKTLYNYVDAGLIGIKNHHLPEKLSRKSKQNRAKLNKRKLGRSIEERPSHIDNTLKYVPDKDRKAFASDLKTIYHASDEEKARLALDRVTEK